MALIYAYADQLVLFKRYFQVIEFFMNNLLFYVI